MTTCCKYDVVVVPFPFTENANLQKPRPVAVLSNENYSRETGNFLAVMISSSELHTAFDVEIQNPEAVGLFFESWLKPKIATLPVSFIKKALGTLAEPDRNALDGLIFALT